MPTTSDDLNTSPGDVHSLEQEAEEDRLRLAAELDTETIGQSMPRNSWGGTAIRLALSMAMLGILWWRLPHVRLADLVPVFDANTVKWLAAAVGIHVIAYLMQNMRWYQVSVTLGLTTPYRRLLGFLLAGEFVSNALPTSFGGDVIRVMRQGSDVDDYADAFAATALERLTGWLVLPFISTLALIMRPSLMGMGHASVIAILTNIATVVGLIGVLWAAGHRRFAARMGRGDAAWRRFLTAVHLGIVTFRDHKVRATWVLLAGLAFQMLQCLSVFAAAKALRLDGVDLIVVMAFFPPAAVIQNLPIALGGLGVREAAFVMFFGAVGVAEAPAISLGLTVYFVFIVASLAGAPNFVLHRRSAEAAHSA